MQTKSVLNGKTINLTGDNTIIKSTNFNVDTSGNMTCKNATVTGNVTASNGKIAGYTINGNMLVGANVGISGKSGEGWAFWAGSNDAGSAPFKVGHDGSVYASNANIQGTVVSKNGTFTGGNISLSGGTIDNPKLQVVSSSSSSTKASIAPDAIRIGSGSVYLSFSSGILNIRNDNSSFQMLASSSRINAGVDNFYVTGTVHANAYNYDSLESLKKNIKKYNKNVLDIIKNGEIYEFNFKTEDNKIKKHIGFVIPDEGGNFYTPPEVLAQDGMGIDSYNMTSILWKAVQEQQEQIEQMKNEIKELKGER